MPFVNMTPHSVDFQLPNGERVKFPNSGRDARVDSAVGTSGAIEVDGLVFPTTTSPILTDVYIDWSDKTKESDRQSFPEPQENVVYIVSLMVLQHPSMAGRADVIAPATGPKDGAIRFPDTNIDGSPNPRKGQIDAVTKWVTAPAK